MGKFINKQTVITFAVTAIVFTGIGAAAEQAYRIYPNPYPVIVNGVETPVEGFNIDDYTYLKLSDLGKLLGAKLRFNTANESIEVTSDAGLVPAEATPTPTPTPAPTPSAQPEVKETFKDGIPGVEYKGTFYIGLDIVSSRYSGFKLVVSDGKLYKFVNTNKGTEFPFVLDDEEMVVRYNDKYYFKYDAVRVLFEDFQIPDFPPTTADGIKVNVIDGRPYILISDITAKYADKGYSIFMPDYNKNVVILRNAKGDVLLGNIPVRAQSGYLLIEYAYYADSILPVLKGN